jgi:transposase InsO family protein
MRLHGNARTCPHSRLLLCRRVVEQGWSLVQVAEAAGVSERTVAKWLGRYRAEGEAGLGDRSSAPGEVANRTAEERIELLAALRRLRMTAAEIAEVLAMPVSTVSGILTRIGLGRLSRLEPLEPPNRYERQRPGELVHIDVKKLGRIRGVGHRVTGSRATQRETRRQGNRVGVAGWEYVHVCVDDATRLAYVEVLTDEKATTAIGFRVEAVLTDNGSAYRATIHSVACRALGIKHLRTRPYRPQTNGKAERFIRTLLGGWAYGAIYGNSQERQRALTGWLDFYNHRRPHGSLNHQAPMTRLHALMNNPLGSYT